MTGFPRRLTVVLAAALVAVAAVTVLLLARSGGEQRAEACPPGYLTSEEHEVLERAERRYERDHFGKRQGGEEKEQAAAGACYSRSHPETAGEFLAAKSFSEGRDLAPRREADPRAWGRAVHAYARAAQAGGGDVAGSAGSWSPVGKGPLLSGEPGYEEARFGLKKLNGRVADFAYDASANRLYAAVANGGVWQSGDTGASWQDISGKLPTMIVGSVAWIPAKGSRPGAILALTGDNAFGGYTYPGAGAYRSTDGGKTWTRAAGVPDGALGFKAAVDPTNSDIVWLATGLGLYRSTDGGADFDQVNLPTGSCSGQSLTKKGCFLANVVTDVVVQPKDKFGHNGGRVLAAVGYRAGTRKNADGSVQSPGNGIYTNTTGAPTTFTKQDVNQFVVPFNPGVSGQDSIGRIELGIANGPDQNADYVYAIVQDAYLFNHNGIVGIDAPDVHEPVLGTNPLAKRTVLNGVYVTSNFGQSWTQMANGDSLQTPGKNSALVGVYNAAAGYGPGIQSWYDEFMSVDPTRAGQGGVPTRITFGLEEVWQNSSAQSAAPVPQQGPSDFSVIGRYFSGETCQGGIVTPPVAAEICPTSNPPVQGTTTHPDQHAGITIPTKDGGAALIVGDDGGAYVQKVGPGEAMTNDKWGDGANDGFYTLLPYDAKMAKDGTVYAGLQDNGQMKIQPDGKQIAVQGGDGFYAAVDPDNSKVEYGEVSGGLMYRSTDGGLTSDFIDPALTQGAFVTPFVMDPANAKHLLVAGRDVKESIYGPETTSPCLDNDPTCDTSTNWAKVYDLGTRKHRGDAGATADPASDPNNSASAIAMRGAPAVPLGPKTADVPPYTAGGDTLRGFGTGLPGTYDEHDFTVKPGEVDGTATITIKWASSDDDWDLIVYKQNADGSMDQVGSSANNSTTSESVTLNRPPPGTYVIHADNFDASGTFTGSVSFGDLPQDRSSWAYVGFCGFCDPLTEGVPFDNGIATNVGASGAPGKEMSSDGWHIAAARGLPKRSITGIAIDSDDPRTIFVTLGGYQVRPFVPPGALNDDTSQLGSGHLFVSNDAGESFRDISGDLPDIPATAVLIRRGQPVVATNVGVYIGEDLKGGHFTPMGSDLPPAPVFNLSTKPDDDELVIAASYGRGVQQYRYKDPVGAGPTPGIAPTPAQKAAASACAASVGFRSASAKVVTRGRKVRLSFVRAQKRPVTVQVFQVSRGRTVLKERQIASFSKRARSFTWNGRATGRKKISDGYLFVRYSMKLAGARHDIRRVVLRRSHGHFTKRPDYYRRPSCDILASYKLGRPVFGGPRNRPLTASFRLTRASTATLRITRGKKVVRRYKAKAYRAGRTYRFSLPARGQRRGDYKVRLTVVRGSRRIVSTLTSRRL